MRGRKPKSAVEKMVAGNPGRRPIPAELVVDGSPVKPRWLQGRGAEIWNEVLSFAFWLTRADSYVLAWWCDREAEHEKPRKRAEWTAADRRQHLACASEIGLTAVARSRLAALDANNPGHAPLGRKSPTPRTQDREDPVLKYLS